MIASAGGTHIDLVPDLANQIALQAFEVGLEVMQLTQLSLQALLC